MSQYHQGFLIGAAYGIIVVLVIFCVFFGRKS